MLIHPDIYAGLYLQAEYGWLVISISDILKGIINLCTAGLSIILIIASAGRSEHGFKQPGINYITSPMSRLSSTDARLRNCTIRDAASIYSFYYSGYK